MAGKQTKTIKILIDKSHNEQIPPIKDDFLDSNVIIDYIPLGDTLPPVSFLMRYDIIIIANIIPDYENNFHIFSRDELKAINFFVKHRGSLLILSSSGGDFEYKSSQGSIRSLKTITGIGIYPWGEIFHDDPAYFLEHPDEIIFNKFPDHPIFKGIKRLIFSEATFLKPSAILEERDDEYDFDILLKTPPGTQFRFYEDDSCEIFNEQPMITYCKKVGYKGTCITIGSSSFLGDDPKTGISIRDHRMFFYNLVNFLKAQLL